MIPFSLIFIAVSSGPARELGTAPVSSQLPVEAAGMAFAQRLDTQVPLDATFVDESRRTVTFGNLLNKRPVVLVLAYYRCPQLCNLVLNGLCEGLRGVAFRPGEEYTVIVISIDSREDSVLAAAKKAAYVADFGRSGADENWHFLTGDKEQIDRVADAIGYRYTFAAQHDRFNHPAGVVVLTPGGKVSRYLFGIRYSPRDLKLAMIEAASGQIGSVVDQFLMYCFHYDPANGKYAFAVVNAIRVGGVLTISGLFLFVCRLLWSERQRVPQPGAMT